MLEVTLMDNRIKVIKIKDSINEKYNFDFCFEDGKLCSSSGLVLRSDTNRVESTTFNNKPITFHKKGITYNAIKDSIDNWVTSYFKGNYRLFYDDTLSPYTKTKYSLFFEDYRGIGGNLKFLPFSILYYSVNPEKMENWNTNAKQNMLFLINHFFDDEKTIEVLMEKYGEDGNWDQFRLCQLLKFIKQPNANDYKSVQLEFRINPNFRWIDDSIIW